MSRIRHKSITFCIIFPLICFVVICLRWLSEKNLHYPSEFFQCCFLFAENVFENFDNITIKRHFQSTFYCYLNQYIDIVISWYFAKQALIWLLKAGSFFWKIAALKWWINCGLGLNPSIHINRDYKGVHLFF